MNSQRSGRDLAFPWGVLYLVSFAFVFFQAADVALIILPLRPSVLDWRIGVLGTISGAMMFPLIGFVMALVTAHLLGHLRVQRILAVLYGLLGVFFLLGLFLFIFDMLQLRVQIKPQALRVYDISGVKGMMALSLLTLIFTALSVASFKQTRISTRRAEREKAIDSPASPVFAPAAKPAN